MSSPSLDSLLTGSSLEAKVPRAVANTMRVWPLILNDKEGDEKLPQDVTYNPIVMNNEEVVFRI